MSQPPRRVRRRPNFLAFLITGALVGLVVGIVLGVVGPVDARYDAGAAVGFIGLICAGLGMLVGGIAVVLVDRRS